jgi:hypothetical protein
MITEIIIIMKSTEIRVPVTLNTNGLRICERAHAKWRQTVRSAAIEGWCYGSLVSSIIAEA